MLGGPEVTVLALNLRRPNGWTPMLPLSFIGLRLGGLTAWHPPSLQVAQHCAGGRLRAQRRGLSRWHRPCRVAPCCSKRGVVPARF